MLAKSIVSAIHQGKWSIEMKQQHHENNASKPICYYYYYLLHYDATECSLHGNFVHAFSGFEAETMNVELQLNWDVLPMASPRCSIKYFRFVETITGYGSSLQLAKRRAISWMSKWIEIQRYYSDFLVSCWHRSNNRSLSKILKLNLFSESYF